MAAERLPTVPARGVGSPGSDAPRVISTFSGCGGSSLGLTWAGFSVAAAVEFVPAAAATYRANFPTTPVVTRDIRDISGSDLLVAASGVAGALRAVGRVELAPSRILLRAHAPTTTLNRHALQAPPWSHRHSPARSETTRHAERSSWPSLTEEPDKPAREQRTPIPA